LICATISDHKSTVGDTASWPVSSDFAEQYKASTINVSLYKTDSGSTHVSDRPGAYYRPDLLYAHWAHRCYGNNRCHEM